MVLTSFTKIGQSVQKLKWKDTPIKKTESMPILKAYSYPSIPFRKESRMKQNQYQHWITVKAYDL